MERLHFYPTACARHGYGATPEASRGTRQHEGSPHADLNSCFAVFEPLVRVSVSHYDGPLWPRLAGTSTPALSRDYLLQWFLSSLEGKPDNRATLNRLQIRAVRLSSILAKRTELLDLEAIISAATGLLRRAPHLPQTSGLPAVSGRLGRPEVWRTDRQGFTTPKV